MPEGVDVAHALTDAAVVHMSAIVPVIAGGAAALSCVVASCIVWLCYAELHRPSHRTQRATTRAFLVIRARSQASPPRPWAAEEDLDGRHRARTRATRA